MRVAELADQDTFPAEDPSQSWNALSIGGYTDFSTVTDPGYETWSALVVTLKGRRVDIDLHTPISVSVQPPVEIDLPLEI